jgi:hypothetical protein
MANFISISGKAGSGKTTLSSRLHTYFHNEGYTLSEFSFAGPIKDALCLWFGWDRRRLDSDFSYKEGSTLDDGSPDPYCQRLGMTRRVLMQKFGTEGMRRGVHQDFWIILADVALELGKISPSDIYVISDARFFNELEWVKSLNGYRLEVSRVECPRGEDPKSVLASTTLTTSTAHPSEQEFVGWSGYDEHIVNLVDHNKNQIGNLKTLNDYLDKTTIPAIRKRFGLVGRGKNDWSLYR